MRLQGHLTNMVQKLMNKYPEKIGVLASLPLPEIDAAVEEVKYCRENLHEFLSVCDG